MDFNHFLTSYMPDPSIGSKVHFQNMIDQAILAEKLGYKNSFNSRTSFSKSFNDAFSITDGG